MRLHIQAGLVHGLDYLIERDFVLALLGHGYSEALSCGTPVIAYPSGALPEIVEDGRTGFIVNSQSEMASALRAVKFIDPEVCRRVAAERFSAERMAQRYIQRYTELLRWRHASTCREACPFNTS